MTLTDLMDLIEEASEVGATHIGMATYISNEGVQPEAYPIDMFIAEKLPDIIDRFGEDLKHDLLEVYIIKVVYAHSNESAFEMVEDATYES